MMTFLLIIGVFAVLSMATTLSVEELGEQLETKRKAYFDLFDSFEKKKLADGSESPVIPSEKIKELEDMRGEIDEIGKQYTETKSQVDFAEQQRREREEKANNRLGGQRGNDPDPNDGARMQKSIAEYYMESEQFKNRSKAPFYFGDFDEGKNASHEDLQRFEAPLAIQTKGAALERGTKATMTTTSDGYPPETLREGALTFSAQKPPQIVDTLPMRRTQQTAIKFMHETVFTNTAAAVAEGAAPSEATLTYAEVSKSIERVSVFITATEEQLDDVPGMQDIINQRLLLMIRQEMDIQVMTAAGSGSDLTGIENLSGIQTQAKSTDPTFDAIRKAMTKVRVTGRANPDRIYLHSNDYEAIRLTRTADGLYIMGNPMTEPRPMLFGLPVIENDVQTENTGIVLDSFYTTIVMRTGLELAMTDSHASNFTSHILTIRGSVRLGLECRRDASVCEVTGI